MSRQTTLTDSPDSSDSDIEDSHTSKLKYARDYYLGSSSVLDCNSLTDDLVHQLYEDFNEFKTTKNYLALERTNEKCQKEHIAVKLSKRGNEVYRREKRDRIFDLVNGLEHSDKDLNFTDRDLTSALLVTLTYDRDRCSIKSAWDNIAKEYNQAVTSLRQKYGDLSVFRIFEGYKNGYPHIHMIVLFEDQEFETFEHNGKIRIKEKSDVSDGLNWHSYVDVEGVQHISKSVHYLAKYFVKDTVDISDSPDNLRKAKLTLALNWLFRKRSFAISGDFKKVLNDLIHGMSNSNKAVDLKSLFLFLEGENRYNYEFITTFSGDLLDFDESETYIELSTKQRAILDLQNDSKKEVKN